jgi:hypothetical protein
MNPILCDPPIPDDAIYKPCALRNFRVRSSALLRGESTQLVLGFIGDSWVRGSGLPALGEPDRARYFMPGLTAALQQRYGDAGGGWCGLSYATSNERRGGSANSNRLYQAGTGSWTTHTNDRPVPDLCTSVSSASGDVIRVTNTIGPTSGVSLHYLPGGTIDYRWNEEPWTRLALVRTGGSPVAALTGFPRHGAWTLDLRVASGTVELAGIEHRSGNPGVRIHNFGAGGSTASQWNAVDPEDWQASLASFACDTFLTLFGTNDQKQITPEAHRQCLEDLVRKLRLACPDADIGLGTSPESGDTTPPRPERPMRLYRTQARSLARAAALCHIDLQPAFGSITDYRYGGKHALMDASLIHPGAGGIRVLEALYLSLLGKLDD